MLSSKFSPTKRIGTTALILTVMGLASSAWAQDLLRKTKTPALNTGNSNAATQANSGGFTAEDERAIRGTFMNNKCAATFVPEDVAENTLRVFVDDAMAKKLAEELSLRGFGWNGNSRNQNYIGIYPVLAAVVRGSASTNGGGNLNIREVLGSANLPEANNNIIENSQKFREKVDAIAKAGFRFQIDAMQVPEKAGDLGLLLEKVNPVDSLAAQLGYLTKNEQGTYIDSAFFAAYLGELTKLSLKATR